MHEGWQFPFIFAAVEKERTLRGYYALLGFVNQSLKTHKKCIPVEFLDRQIALCTSFIANNSCKYNCLLLSPFSFRLQISLLWRSVGAAKAYIQKKRRVEHFWCEHQSKRDKQKVIKKKTKRESSSTERSMQRPMKTSRCTNPSVSSSVFVSSKRKGPRSSFASKVLPPSCLPCSQ